MARCPICRVPHHRLGRRPVMRALVDAPRAIVRALGRLRVAEILTHWAEHDLNHLEQIRAALRASDQRNAVRR